MESQLEAVSEAAVGCTVALIGFRGVGFKGLGLPWISETPV